MAMSVRMRCWRLQGLRPLPVAASLVLSLSPAPARVAAQAPPSRTDARLQGVVVDQETYQPVESAIVSLVGTDFSVTTGRWGAFAFPDAPSRQLQIRVSAPGHPSVVQDVDVRRGRLVFVQVVLPSVAAALSELFVRAPPASVASAELAQTAADLLALEEPRTRVNASMVGETDFQLRLRDAKTTFSDRVEPLVLIDGVATSGSGAFEALMSIPAADVEEIQVLEGPAAAFLYPYAANGVINVKTKRGAAKR